MVLKLESLSPMTDKSSWTATPAWRLWAMTLLVTTLLGANPHAVPPYDPIATPCHRLGIGLRFTSTPIRLRIRVL